MRVLVTGATGFVGRAVVRRLAHAGHQPVAAVHHRAATFPAGVETVAVDVLDPQSVKAAATGVDAVCHLAAITRGRESFAQPIRYYRVNLDGTLNVLEALASAGSEAPPKLVFVSTCLVYGEPEQQPIGEDAVPQPTNPYGASKLAAEQAVAAQAATGAIGATVIRTFNVAGAVDGITDQDEARIIPKAIAVASGRADVLYVNGDGSVVREFVHVDDLAAAVLLGLDNATAGQCQTYNVGSGDGVSLRDIIATTEMVTGKRLPVEHRPPAPEPQRLVSDSSRIRQKLGWQPARSDLHSIVEDAWRAETMAGYANAA